MLTYLLFLFLHIVLAAFWVGGMLFLPLIMLPSIKYNPERREILIKSGLKFRYYGWGALIGLFLTGWSNMYFKGMRFDVDFLLHTSIGKMLLLKLIIFFLMLSILAIHDIFIGKQLMQNDSAQSTRLTKMAKYTGRINLVLSILIILLGILLSRGIGL